MKRGKPGSTGARAAVYARVSTSVQEAEGTSLVSQLAATRAAAEEHGWHVIGEFVDGGVSGKLASRPALDELVECVTRNEVDFVIVKSVDRFGRSLRNTLTLVELFMEHDTQLIALTDGFDLNSPSGLLHLQIMGAVAQMEWSIIRMRTMEGTVARVSQGGWPGGPAPFGFDLAPNPDGPGTVLRLNVEEAATLRLAYQAIVEQGLTTGQAARALNQIGALPRRAGAWGSGAHLRTQLKSAVGLSGTWVFNRRETSASGTPRIEVPVPPILTTEEHEALLARLEITTTTPGRRRIYTLSRRFIAECGGSMTGRSSHSRERWYRCTTRAPNGRKQCDCVGLPADRFEAEVWSHVCSFIEDPGSIADLADDATRARNDLAASQQAELDEVDRQIALIEQRVGDQGAQLLAAGLGIEEVAAVLRSGAKQAEALREHRTLLLRLRQRDVAVTSLVDYLDLAGGDLAQALRDADASLQSTVLAALDVRVSITGWAPCSTCEGRGLVKAPFRRPGDRSATGVVCPTCVRTRALPRYTITGVLPSALNFLDRTATEPVLEAPKQPVALAFRLEVNASP